MTNPFFSIVVPVYNKRESVGRCIDSVLAQLFKSFELILVDDGSTDGSLDVCKNRLNDPRIKLIPQKNQGVACARNKGWQLARSSYICFLDADDSWSPSFLQEIYELIAKSPSSGFFSCRYKTIMEDGSIFIGNLKLPKGHKGKVDNFISAYRSSRSLICSSNICIRQDLLEKIGGFPSGIKVGEDVYLWLRLGLISEFSFSANIAATVHRDAENRTKVRVKPQIPYFFLYFMEGDGKADLKSSEALCKFLIYYCFVYSFSWVESGNKRLTYDLGVMASKHWPLWGLAIKISSITPMWVGKILKDVRNSRKNKA